MKTRTLRLILGDQLHAGHSWFRACDDEVVYVMMEIHQESEYVTHHVQKVIAFFLAMRAFADELVGQGHRVHYIRIDQSESRQSLTQNLDALISQYAADEFEYQAPDEYRLDEQLRVWSKSTRASVRMLDTEHFLTQRNEWQEIFRGKKQRLMETFYRAMRRKWDIMMHDDEPWGGQWNFDHDNRSKYNGEVPLIDPISFRKDVTDVLRDLEAQGIKTMGSLDATHFNWPITRGEAKETLRYFCEHLLPHFGRYQDAMVRNEHYLYHSRLSFCLNAKLLHPMEVIHAAVEAHTTNPDWISLASTEGFVRQILGWREYMRGLYWSEMPNYATRNALNHHAALPDWFWTGETKMACLSQCIGQSLSDAYAHHIQRLMVIGNFCLLAGIAPAEVHRWYLGVYIDAIEWVEITNTLGMSQYADGGIVATKPYVSGGNYINNMSNYCSNCHYSVKEKMGQRACPLNSMYWNFIDRHAERWEKNPRMAMMVRTWQKRHPDDRAAVLNDVARLLSDLNAL